MIYAIGDIHGYSGALDRALALVERDGGPEAPIVFLGDLVDRGPDSRGVIERLMTGCAEGRPWRVVFGNHDRMFLRFVTGGIVHDAAIASGKGWLHPALGGPTTILSYLPDLDLDHPDWHGANAFLRDGLDGADPSLTHLVYQALREAVPIAQTDWIAANPRMVTAQGLVFVHAGLRPGVALDRQAEDDLIWIRGDWLTDRRDYGNLVVHGHTALDHPKHYGNRLNVDGGAGFGRPLVPVAIEGREAWALTDEGRVPLRP